MNSDHELGQRYKPFLEKAETGVKRWRPTRALPCEEDAGITTCSCAFRGAKRLTTPRGWV